MWQFAMMWSLVPTAIIAWIVNGLIVVGLVGICASWIARWIPVVNTYRGPVQLVGIVCLVLGVYMKGGADVEMRWRTQAAELQAKADLAAEQSRMANAKLSEEIRKNQKLTKDVKDAVKAGIKANAGKMDSQCTVDSVAIELHNRSSLNQVPRSTKGTVEVVPNVGTTRPIGTQVK
jgi:hypothetical protein